jgi:hydroxyacylglutathione hydrolase
MKKRIIFFERQFPSANMVLIEDQLSILVDTGFGSDWQLTEHLIRETGLSPDQLNLVVNTHYHSDHVGGNHKLQQVYGREIAAHSWEASLINTRNREACSAGWLNQPVENFQVNRLLVDGDEIETGTSVLQVIHTPGHTLGHISLYDPNAEILISGDLLHRHDVGWLNPFREGVASLQRSIESLDRISRLPLQAIYPGHGPAILVPKQVINEARIRFEKWQHSPEKVAWHAVKRIFSFALIISGGIERERISEYLLSCGWFQDFSRHAFEHDPEDFVKLLVKEMIRSQAAIWHGERLRAVIPHNVPTTQWIQLHQGTHYWTIPS